MKRHRHVTDPVLDEACQEFAVLEHDLESGIGMYAMRRAGSSAAAATGKASRAPVQGGKAKLRRAFGAGNGRAGAAAAASPGSHAHADHADLAALASVGSLATSLLWLASAARSALSDDDEPRNGGRDGDGGDGDAAAAGGGGGGGRLRVSSTASAGSRVSYNATRTDVTPPPWPPHLSPSCRRGATYLPTVPSPRPPDPALRLGAHLTLTLTPLAASAPT